MPNCSRYIEQWLQQHWQNPRILGWLLLPFSYIFVVVARIRRLLYQRLAYHSHVPVVIIGNISVGGTGKTPTVIALANLLSEHGYRVGIATRGYKSRISSQALVTTVKSSDDPDIVGDEPLLLAARTKCQVVIAKSRSLAVKELENHVDVILCDDGLQHYRLARDIEIAVVDGKRKYGNGFCLPMGPLREPVTRLKEVDFVLENGRDLQLLPQLPLNGKNQEVNAVAGIGNPQRFFSMLRSAGYIVTEHIFSDHHKYTPKDFNFPRKLPIVTTEKDAVKCSKFIPDLQVITIGAQLSSDFIDAFLSLLKEKQHARSKSTRYSCLPNL